MNTNYGRLLVSVLGLTSVLALGPSALAGNQQAGKAAKEPTKQERQDMAKMHRKMADCLDSKKPMIECRSEMMKSCHAMMEKGGSCPMMGEMGGMSGMMGDDHHDHHDTE